MISEQLTKNKPVTISRRTFGVHVAPHPSHLISSAKHTSSHLAPKRENRGDRGGHQGGVRDGAADPRQGASRARGGDGGGGELRPRQLTGQGPTVRRQLGARPGGAEAAWSAGVDGRGGADPLTVEEPARIRIRPAAETDGGGGQRAGGLRHDGRGRYGSARRRMETARLQATPAREEPRGRCRSGSAGAEPVGVGEDGCGGLRGSARRSRLLLLASSPVSPFAVLPS